jgi:hypothetical protein
VLEKFGFDPAAMSMKPTAVDRCVYEGLRALTQNRPVIIPGGVNRIMNARHFGRYGAPADGQHARQDPGDGRYAATAVRFISAACSLWHEAAQAIASSSSAKPSAASF